MQATILSGEEKMSPKERIAWEVMKCPKTFDQLKEMNQGIDVVAFVWTNEEDISKPKEEPESIHMLKAHEWNYYPASVGMGDFLIYAVGWERGSDSNKHKKAHPRLNIAGQIKVTREMYNDVHTTVEVKKQEMARHAEQLKQRQESGTIRYLAATNPQLFVRPLESTQQNDCV